MTTTWTIAIDWNRDGDYGDSYEDVTSRVVSTKWFLGQRKPWQDTADNSLLELALDNSDKQYSPENSSSPLWDGSVTPPRSKVQPFRPVRIQSNDGTTTRTHWVGWIEKIEPEVGRYGKRLIKIAATGVMQFYKAAETKLPLQENKRTDEIIAELIKEVVIPPSLNRAWVLDRVGNSELGTTTYLADTSAYSVLDTGALTVGMAGDNWVRQGGYSDVQQDSYDVYRAIGEITAAEHGKFLFDREGKALFWNRHHLLQGATAAATFDDTMTEMGYTYAEIDECKNEIIAVCHPRKIGATATDVLWDLGDAIIRVEPGKTREIFVKYEDESKNRIGGRDVTVSDVEFDAGTATVSIEAKANGAELKFTNSGTAAAIVKKCKVKGRKITDSGEMEAKAIDSSSHIDYGRRTLRLNLPSIDSLESAQYIADFERDRRGQPRGTVTSVTVASHGKNGGGQHAHQLARTLGDLITIRETQTGHDKNYYIVGEAHELTNSATLWKTTWYLEPAPASYPWKLGVEGRSELGDATVLTY
jgi:hypothetical protein